MARLRTYLQCRSIVSILYRTLYAYFGRKRLCASQRIRTVDKKCQPPMSQKTDQCFFYSAYGTVQYPTSCTVTTVEPVLRASTAYCYSTASRRILVQTNRLERLAVCDGLKLYRQSYRVKCRLAWTRLRSSCNKQHIQDDEQVTHKQNPSTGNDW